MSFVCEDEGTSVSVRREDARVCLGVSVGLVPYGIVFGLKYLCGEGKVITQPGLGKGSRQITCPLQGFSRLLAVK